MSIPLLMAHETPLVREGFQMMLKQDPTFHLVGVVATIEELMKLAAKHQQEEMIMLIDGKLEDAFQAVVSLRLKGVWGILVFAPSTEEADFFKFFRGGAQAYTNLSISSCDLLEMLHCLAAHHCMMRFDEKEQYTPVISLKQLLLLVAEDDDAHTDDSKERHSLLAADFFTKKEKAMLRYMAVGYRNRDIAHTLQISDLAISGRMASLFKKLNVDNRTSAVVVALRNDIISLRDLPPSMPLSTGTLGGTCAQSEHQRAAIGA